ncbi:MAG: permease-like cell division protein FtsX [Dokdonella sp.]
MSSRRSEDKASANRLREAAPANQSVRRARRPLGARFSGWRQAHRDSLAASVQRLVARAWATSLTVLVIGLALALPLLLHVILDNARQLSGGLRDAREVTVFLKPTLDAPAATAFAAEIDGRGDVVAVSMRSPEQGLAEFRQLSGFAEALDVLAHNPLPSVLVVTPRSGESAENVQLIAELDADVRVDMVQHDAAWRQRLTALLGFGERAMLALVGLLALATLLIVGNTVRMDIQGRAEEIAVLQLIGASDAFVRRPFLYAGVCYGILGGALALLAVAAVQLVLAEPLQALLTSYQNRFDIHPYRALDAAALVGISALLGWLGAWIVSTSHLRAGRPRA